MLRTHGNPEDGGDRARTARRFRARSPPSSGLPRSEEHTSELQSPCNLVCRLLLEKIKSSEKRLDLAQLAATRGISLVKNAECRLLFQDGSCSEQVEEAQRPLLRHPVAAFAGLRAV